MKRNKIVSFFLSLGLVFLVGLSAFSFPTGASAGVKGEDDGTYYTGKSADQILFDVSPGYGHLKVYVKNRGESSLYVTLTHKPTGKVYIDRKEIRVGDPAFEWASNKEGYPQGVRGGQYELYFSSGKKAAYLDWAYKPSSVLWP
ncbi:hypothetical protein [Bacillus bombysepticus]|uniref:hypothetical protein n=1 Tax=Bacillus bombysepticus TaxID=658666 RepID=UPI00301B54FC